MTEPGTSHDCSPDTHPDSKHDSRHDSRTDPLGPDVSRRTMMRGVTMGGLALPLLAACGSPDSSDSADSSSSTDSTDSTGSSGDSGDSGSSSSGSSASGSGAGTVAASDVPVGGGTIVAGDKVVVTQPTKGDFKAFSSICTHSGCPVTSVADGEIVCPCHGSRFSIEDGSATRGPATKPLAAKKVSDAGGTLTIS